MVMKFLILLASKGADLTLHLITHMSDLILLQKYAPQQARMPVIPIFMNGGDQTYWS
jgi:hypothetical protein